MMPETMIDPQALYDAEIKRKQGELAVISSELSKLQAQRNLLNDESVHLGSEIQKQKDEIAGLIDKHKKADEDFKNSRANSIAALNKRDKESQDRLDAADKRDAASKELQYKATTARNQLISIAEDQLKTLEKIETNVKAMVDSVRDELKAYLLLRDPKAEIPDLKKK